MREFIKSKFSDLRESRESSPYILLKSQKMKNQVGFLTLY